MSIRYTHTALLELDQVFAFIAASNVAAAARVVDRIEEAIGHLSDFPYAAQAADEPDVRRLTIRGLPYVVFYSVEGNEILILHIRHGARRSPWDLDPRGGAR